MIAAERAPIFEEIADLMPIHPVTRQTAFLVGQIQGQEPVKGNVLLLNDLIIAAAAIEQGYAVLTENRRHFQDPRPDVLAVAPLREPGVIG